jgi:hypothetical protein
MTLTILKLIALSRKATENGSCIAAQYCCSVDFTVADRLRCNAPAASPTSAPASGGNVIDFNSVGVAGAVQAYRLTAPAGYRAIEAAAGYSLVSSEDSSVTFQVAEVNPQAAAVAALTEVGSYTVNGREVKAYNFSAVPNAVYFHVPVDGNVYNVVTTTTDTSAAALERLANIAGTLEVVGE